MLQDSIQDFNFVLFGATGNLSFSKLIPAKLKATIYTYSLPIAMQLSQHPNIDLIFIGGSTFIVADLLKFLHEKLISHRWKIYRCN